MKKIVILSSLLFLSFRTKHDYIKKDSFNDKLNYQIEEMRTIQEEIKEIAKDFDRLNIQQDKALQELNLYLEKNDKID